MLRKLEPHVANDYPSSDGRPMAETDWHRVLMTVLIETLQHRYEADPNAYVSGNLLLFYEEGNRRRHLAPDVFVVLGIPNRQRPNYLMWEEGKGPDAVIELTSKTTRSRDTKRKFELYRDRLGVREYYLFDPKEDYLWPSMQGFRRSRGRFRPIAPVGERLPSKVLGLHLERDGEQLRLWDPAAGMWLPTRAERLQAEEARAEAARAQAEAERARARSEQARADRAETEVERLRRELAALRRPSNGAG